MDCSLKEHIIILISKNECEEALNLLIDSNYKIVFAPISNRFYFVKNLYKKQSITFDTYLTNHSKIIDTLLNKVDNL